MTSASEGSASSQAAEATREDESCLGAPDLWAPGYLANPYQALANLRARTPILWHARLGSWVLTRYDDVVEVLGDGERFAPAPAAILPTAATMDLLPLIEDLQRFALSWQLFVDPPELIPRHDAANQALSQRGRTLPWSLSRFADTLVRSLCRRHIVDLVADFAEPLTLHALSHLTGLTHSEARLVRDDSRALTRLLGACFATRVEIQTGHHATHAIVDHVAPALLRHRHDRTDSALEHMADGDGTGGRDLAAWTAALTFTICEVATGLIANAIVTLHRHPQQLGALRRAPDLVPAVLQEVLRFGALTISTRRRALRDSVLSGQPIREGDHLQVMICAANRDPDAYPDPDRFDIWNPHPTSQVALRPNRLNPATRLIFRQAEIALRALLGCDHLVIDTASSAWPANLLLRHANPVTAARLP